MQSLLHFDTGLLYKYPLLLLLACTLLHIERSNWRLLRILGRTSSATHLAIVQVGLLHDEIGERHVRILLVDYLTGVAIGEESL